ncbi:MAG: hypothetical protein ACYDEX_24905 [Mobilitalea sp.]
MAAAISCEKEIQNGPDIQAEKSYIDEGMPGVEIQDMEIDNNDLFYFVTYKLYYTLGATVERWRRRNYLSRKTDEIGEFEILDSNFVQVDKIIFDKDNNLWGLNRSGLYLRKNNTCDTIIDLGYSASFIFLVVDGYNNKWVGGWNTGLYKIDPSLNITKYTTENSDLTSNSMENIHIDESNNIWIASTAMPYKVQKIAGNDWTVFDSPGTKDQAIWSLATDKNANLWIGKGYPYNNETLVRFNGNVWETINPENDKGELVTGIVSQLVSDTNRLYVVVKSNTSRLLTFDGDDWNEISGFPDPGYSLSLPGLTIDNHRQVLWIRVDTGIYKLDL